ncbi:uncharacterized protein LOC116245803 isoform X1 [Nymphaea colorata]|nr:uncharacterized protein LOC116245803 isoform X1 [Nymphaea colorata]
MFPVLPPPYRSQNQGQQGTVNALPGANHQLNNLSNLSNNFTQQMPQYPFPVPNNPLVPQNVLVAPYVGSQLAAPVVAFDNRNANIPSLLGNPLSFQALDCQLICQNQPLSLNQPQGVVHSNERPTVPSSASHMMTPPMIHGHSCAPSQVAQPGGFLNPGFVIGDCRMRPGNSALNCNAAVVPSNMQLQNQCNFIAQLLNQNMMHLAQVLAQQVPVGGLPRPDQVTTGMHHSQPSWSTDGFQQHLMHVSPPPAVNGHGSCSTAQSHPAARQNSSYVAGNSHTSQGNSLGLPVLTMNQNGSHLAPAAAPNLTSGVFPLQGQSLQGMQQKEQMLKVKRNESDSLSIHSHGGQVKTGGISSRRGYHGSHGKELKNSRFHKPSTNHLGQRNDKFMIRTGQVKKGVRNNTFLNSKGQEDQKRKRSIHLTYTEEEILQWQEERKRNYPTTANIEKKAKMLLEMQKDGKSIDANAKIRRRQQLKEILAKQAELGVEVAEIPPGYLSDSQKNCARGHKNKFGRGSFKNKYGRNTELRGDGKQLESLDDKTSPRSVLNSRKPTLLQKLLSTDMERDKSRLLQVFRFMRINSFFEHCPEMHLRLPLVTARDCQSSSTPTESIALANVRIGGYDDDNDDDDENDGVGNVGPQDDGLDATVAVIKEEQKISDIIEDQEEGEIID